MKTENVIELNGKKYILTEVPEQKQATVKNKNFYLVSYEFLPGMEIKHHFKSTAFTIKEGRYRLPNGSVVSISIESLPKPTAIASEYESNLLYTFVKYAIDNKIHRCIKGRKPCVKVSYVKDKNTRPYMDRSILNVRPDYVEAVNLLKGGMCMNEVVRKTGLSKATIYRLNYNFCGYEPTREYKKRRDRRGMKKIYTNEWFRKNYDFSLTIKDNAAILGVSTKTLSDLKKNVGKIDGDVKTVRRRITMYERVDMK